MGVILKRQQTQALKKNEEITDIRNGLKFVDKYPWNQVNPFNHNEPYRK